MQRRWKNIVNSINKKKISLVTRCEYRLYDFGFVTVTGIGDQRKSSKL